MIRNGKNINTSQQLIYSLIYSCPFGNSNDNCILKPIRNGSNLKNINHEIQLKPSEIEQILAYHNNCFQKRTIEFVFNRNPVVNEKLTIREKTILNLLLFNHTNVQIATQLFLSQHTVNCHRRNIYKKLHVTKLSELIKFIISR